MRTEPVKMIFTESSVINSMLKQIIMEDTSKFADKIALDFVGSAYNVENYIFDKLPEYMEYYPKFISAIAELCYKKAVKSIKALECLISAFILKPNEVKTYLHMTLIEFNYKFKNKDIDFFTNFQFFVFGFLYAFGIGNVYNPELAVKCFNNAESIIEAEMFKLLVKAKLLENKFSKAESDQFKLQFDLLRKKLKKVKPKEAKEYFLELQEDLSCYIYDEDFPDNLDTKYKNIYIGGHEKSSLGKLFSAYYAHVQK